MIVSNVAGTTRDSVDVRFSVDDHDYVFVDTANQRTIMLDAYLYSPRKPKRDLLVQMESVARSFKFYTPPVTTDSIANLATDKTDKPVSEDK